MKRLADSGSEFALLSNAQCLTEGIDVVSLDAVAFVDPRQSEVDIVQAVGRAIRKAPDKSAGYVVIPIVCSEADAVAGKLNAAGHKVLRQVLFALRSHDEAFAAEIDNFVLGRVSSVGSGSSGVAVVPERLVIEFGDDRLAKFANALTTRVVELGCPNVDYQRHLGALRQYAARKGHARVPQVHVEPFNGEKLNLGTWVNNRRAEYGKGKLSAERVAELEAVPGWEWDPFEAAYQRNLGALRQYAAREGNARVPKSYVEPFNGEPINLGTWVHSRRKEHRKGRLSAERVAELDALGVEWDPHEASWQRHLGALRQYVASKGNARVPKDYVEPFNGEDLKLGQWVITYRKDRKRGKLSDERFADLDALGFEWRRR